MKRFLLSVAVGLAALNLVLLPAYILGHCPGAPTQEAFDRCETNGQWAAVAGLAVLALGCAYLVWRELR